MASLNEMDIVNDSVARSLGYISLKSEQRAVIKDFVKGNDVFAVLPTGYIYGKSLCYVCLPGVFDEIFDCTTSIIAVVTPLTSIMKDQV